MNILRRQRRPGVQAKGVSICGISRRGRAGGGLGWLAESGRRCGFVPPHFSSPLPPSPTPLAPPPPPLHFIPFPPHFPPPCLPPPTFPTSLSTLPLLFLPFPSLPHPPLPPSLSPISSPPFPPPPFPSPPHLPHLPFLLFPFPPKPPSLPFLPPYPHFPTSLSTSFLPFPHLPHLPLPFIPFPHLLTSPSPLPTSSRNSSRSPMTSSPAHTPISVSMGVVLPSSGDARACVWTAARLGFFQYPHCPLILHNLHNLTQPSTFLHCGPLPYIPSITLHTLHFSITPTSLHFPPLSPTSPTSSIIALHFPPLSPLPSISHFPSHYRHFLHFPPYRPLLSTSSIIAFSTSPLSPTSSTSSIISPLPPLPSTSLGPFLHFPLSASLHFPPPTAIISNSLLPLPPPSPLFHSASTPS
ncbi:hypothetical protein C7M84_001704 [Penaeus vannamei]|uniref:Uncharacterized protein n=1 Tax=Penaeus vannamei TaxID=6689 RepID=A0A3R7MEG4_PENVA|nr:hypothetical protein C7M84_001704 [Penaeus vannamei]